MTGETLASRRAVWTALGCAAAVFAHPGHAEAGGLRDGLFKRAPGIGRPPAAPLIARYVTEDGEGFILDRSQPRPLLKFDDSVEVWVLNPFPAPRGDTIYKNDLGETMLRATRLGGVTLFTDERPKGEAVSLAGGGTPLRLLLLNVQALNDRMVQAAYRSGRAARHGISFQYEASPASTGLMADAAVVVTLAFLKVAEQKRNVLGQIGLVHFVEGAKPTAQLRDNTLWITVAPAQGIVGRPSSKRIVQVLTKGK